MKFIDAIKLFNKLTTEATTKYEKKIHGNFIKILTNLEKRELTSQDVSSIEDKLESLELSTPNSKRKRFYATKYNELTAYLKKEFSLVPEGHYTQMFMLYGIMFGPGIGLTMGMAIDVAIGVGIGLSIGTGVGMSIGLALGAMKDAEAKKQGQVLA